MLNEGFQTVGSASQGADQRPTITGTYYINDSTDEIFISIHFGPMGVAAVTDGSLHGAVATTLALPDGDFNLSLGRGSELDGQRLILHTNVAATIISGAPITLEVTLNLAGGIGPSSETMSMPAGIIGDSVIFVINILFSS